MRFSIEQGTGPNICSHIKVEIITKLHHDSIFRRELNLNGIRLCFIGKKCSRRIR